MSELRLETWTMPAAKLGQNNPFPALHPSFDVDLPTEFPNIPDEMQQNMALGRLPHYLPYTMQDDYNRERSPRDFRVAVLENDILRATFLLELGGRLWSLFHKPSQRELLDVNSVFQPANLAMRHAWFAGGVEWNIGAIAHNAFTCSPIFAARVEGHNGTPVLRLYEWERIRQALFQIDAYLHDGSPVLFVRVRLTNPNSHDIPMYWWSNIAVPEESKTRVLVPADEAYRFNVSRDALDIIPVPQHDNLEISYPARSEHTVDYFFNLQKQARPWITALDEEGRGLIQFSTGRLMGRKLFLWGQGIGGSNWQSFLSEEGHRYIEIQAGLAHTQLEHLRMPAGAQWSWLEGYGLLETDPGITQGGDWAKAQESVEKQLEALLPYDLFKAEYERSQSWLNNPPQEILSRGSGWGALECRRREIEHESLLSSQALLFDDESLTDEQSAWLHLLETGQFPDISADAMPQSYIVSSVWREKLEAFVAHHSDANWMAWLQLGVMRFADGNKEGARQAWQQSLSQNHSVWALRNLAMLEQQEGHLNGAADKYLEAHRMKPELWPLTVETANALLAANRPQEWLNLLPDLPDDQRQRGRTKLLEAWAALDLNDFERVQQLLDEAFIVEDLREGERSLSQLWIDYHSKRISISENRPVDDDLREMVLRDYPIPQAFNFRMGV